MWSPRRTPVDQVLGLNISSWYCPWAVSVQIRYHAYYDPCPSCWRCLQFRYVSRLYVDFLCCRSLLLTKLTVSDLRIYPGSFFDFLMSVGLLIVRHKRKALNLPRPEFKAWDIVIWFSILKNLYLLVMPWYPPAGGATGGDVSFWYGTYVVASIGM